jgi:hypothetical protein
VDWAEVQSLADELASWLQRMLGMKKRPRSIAELGPWPKGLSEEVLTKVHAAAAAHLMLTDLLARRERNRIRDLATFRKWRRESGIKAHEDDKAILPFFETSDVENLLEALQSGSRWAESLKPKIEAFTERERERGAVAAPLRGVVENKEATIARLVRFQRALLVGIARLEEAVAQGNDAVRYPPTVRGQNALIRLLQGRLKAAGFKPRELPKILRQRRY